jgi:glycosyltransferase involved in cell wall biosynthesis
MLEQANQLHVAQELPLRRRGYRVLLVDLTWAFGGVETRVVSQAQALQAVVDGCAVAVLAGSPVHERLRAAGIACEVLPPLQVRDPRLALRLRDVIRRQGYQIVDAHNVPAIVWGHLGALLAGAQGRVTTIHGDYRREYPGLKGIGYEAALRLDRRITRQYVTIVEMLQAKAIAQGQGRRSSLIHNTVPVPDTLQTEKQSALLAEWGFQPGDFVVGNIASLTPRKGQRYLLAALAQLRDLPQIKLLIVGDGALRPQLEAQAASAGIADRVHFAGFRRDIPRVLQAIDCFCMASFMEGLPYAMLEAGAYGRPLVVTAVGGIVGVLEHRSTALLVPPRDPAALAAALRELATQPDVARKLGQAAYVLVRDSFSSIEAMVGKTLQVYDRALAAQ